MLRMSPNTRIDSPAEVQATFEALNFIAGLVEPHEAAWKAVWMEVLDSGQPPGANWPARLAKACADLNAAIAPHVADIARITGNAETTLRSVYRPTSPICVWFVTGPSLLPSVFLRKVARHRSFNMQCWAQKEREEDLQLLMASAGAGAGGPALGEVAAAQAIVAGGVPTVLASALRRASPAVASPLEQQLFVRGVLEVYLPHHVELWQRLRAANAIERNLAALPSDLSATRSLAFIAPSHDPGTQAQIVYWPQHRTARHQQRVAWEPAPTEHPEPACAGEELLPRA